MLPRFSCSHPKPRTHRWQSRAKTRRYGIAETYRAQRERHNDPAALARWPTTRQQDRHRPQRNQSHTAGWPLSSDRQTITSRNGEEDNFFNPLVSEKVRTYLVRIWQSEKKTILLVTHYIDEAIYVSDRILVMTPAPGRIDRKIEIDLSRPRDRTSESFLRLRSDILDHLHLAGKTTADASA